MTADEYEAYAVKLRLLAHVNDESNVIWACKTVSQWLRTGEDPYTTRQWGALFWDGPEDLQRALDTWITNRESQNAKAVLP